MKTDECEMSKVQARGQITLPACMRKRLGIGPTDWLAMACDGEKIIIKKLKEEAWK